MIIEGQNKNGDPFEEKDWVNFEKDINKSGKVRFIALKFILNLFITLTIIYL